MTLFEKALKTLGLNKLSSKQELKKAYREKSKECHPDNGGDGIEFINLNKCYQYLNSKFSEKYIINFGIEDIISDKKFEINDHIQIKLTPSNIKSRIIKFKCKKKKFSIKLKYKDSKEYPLTVENDNVYVNVFQNVGIQEFINNKAIFNVGDNCLVSTGIPNKGKLESNVKLRDNFYLRISFEIFRPECGNPYRITSEDMKGVYNVK